MANCTIEQCDKKTHAKGLCSKHYQRLLKPPALKAFNQTRNRCNNPNNARYKDYGGRGIKVCDRWNGAGGYKNFIEDMGEKPDGMTLDRIDNDGDYEPGNCRWATYEEQSLNKRAYKSSQSGVTGVYQFKRTGAWIANMRTKGVNKHIGYYKTKEEAIAARLRAELEREARYTFNQGRITWKSQNETVTAIHLTSQGYIATQNREQRLW